MVNDTMIKLNVELLEKNAKTFLKEVNDFNPTAYSDRILEEIIEISHKIESLYSNNKSE